MAASIVHALVTPVRERTPWMLWNLRAWLCDKGIPCPDCTNRMKEAEEQLGEVYDIVCDAIDPKLKGLLSIVSQDKDPVDDALQQIKAVCER